MTLIVSHAVLACITAIALVFLLRRAARRVGLVDHPGGRKQHSGSVPLVGGIAICIAFGFSAMLITQSEPLYPFRSLLAGLGVLLLAGFLDDMRELGPLAKLAMQCVAALLMASWGGISVTHLGDLIGTGSRLPLGDFAIPFTVICVLGTINAINMTDGVDGLAGGLSFISLCALAAICSLAKLNSHLLMVAILMGAVAGFLGFNLRHPLRRRASVFLGDAGSMALGFALCWFAVSIAKVPEAGVPAIAMVWVLAVPLIDMGVVILRRILAGRSPLHADREHLHHLLIRSGMTDTATTWTLLAFSAVTAATGFAIWRYRVPEMYGMLGFAALVLTTTIVVQVANRRLARASGELVADTYPPEGDVPGPADDPRVVPLRDNDAREIRKR